MNGTRKQLIEVFIVQLLFNLKSETRKTYLNYLWWVLEPALFTAVFYLVFAVFLSKGSDDFVLFLLCGKIPFLWFSKSVSNASNSIVAGKGLIHQIAIPKAYFPMLIVGQDFIKQLFVMAFLFIFLVYADKTPQLEWLYFIPIMITQLLLIIACSLVAAAITPFVPDFKFLINTGMMLLMFGSGIFYSYKDVINPKHQDLFLMNPLANLIKNYREVMLDYQAPDWNALAVISVCSILLILIMKLWFKVKDSAYARVVIQ